MDSWGWADVVTALPQISCDFHAFYFILLSERGLFNEAHAQAPIARWEKLGGPVGKFVMALARDDLDVIWIGIDDKGDFRYEHAVDSGRTNEPGPTTLGWSREKGKPILRLLKSDVRNHSDFITLPFPRIFPGWDNLLGEARPGKPGWSAMSAIPFGDEGR